MATVTSTAQGGPWLSPTTWVGGSLPVAGSDVVEIPQGAVVTVTDSLTIGDGGSGVSLVYGVLSLSNSTITLTGEIRSDGAGIIEFNTCSIIGAGTGEVGLWVWNSPDAELTMTSCSLSKTSGTFVTGGQFGDGGRVTIIDCTMVGLGGAGLAALQLVGNGHNVEGLSMTSCGRMTASGTPTGGSFTLIDTGIFLSLDENACAFFNFSNAGDFVVNNCVFDTTTMIDSHVGLSVDNCCFMGGLYTLSSSGAGSDFRNNYMGNFSILPPVNTRTMAVMSGANPHFLGARSDLAEYAIDSVIVEQLTGLENDTGDAFLLPEPDAANHTTLTNFLTLPNADEVASATAFSALGNANSSVTLTNFTCYGYAAAVAETYGGHAGQVPLVRDGIVWARSGDPACDVVHDVATAAAGTVTQVDHIGLLNITAPYRVDPGTIANTPGVGDVVGDPLFVDPTRDCRKYATTFLGVTGDAEAQRLGFLNALRTKWDQSADSFMLQIGAIYDWIRAGFVPTAPAYKTGSSVGGYLGAVIPTSIELGTSSSVVSVASSTPAIALALALAGVASLVSVTSSAAPIAQRLNFVPVASTVAVVSSMPTLQALDPVVLALLRRYPQFATCTPEALALACEDAAMLVEDEIWTVWAERGRSNLAAHYLTLFAISTSASPQSPVMSKQVGDVSVSFATGISTWGSNVDLASTKFGQEYLRLRKFIGFPGAIV